MKKIKNNFNTKIKFQKVREKDLTIIKKWRNSLDIFPFNTQYILLNMENQKRWFDTINNVESKRQMFIAYFEKNPIGICGLINIDNENQNGDIAIIIGETKFQGKGIGSIILKKLLDVGFKKLKLNRIGAEVLDYNNKSENLFRKLNFKFEGTYRHTLWREGKWHNTNVFSILKEEFRENYDKSEN